MILPLSLIARNVPPDTINSAIQSEKLCLFGITLEKYIAKLFVKDALIVSFLNTNEQSIAQNPIKYGLLFI